VWCVVTLIERRWVWTIVVGLAMAFSKETGVLVYGVAGLCYVLWYIARGPRPWRARAAAARRLAPLAIPLVVFAAYVLAYVVLWPTAAAVWTGETSRRAMARQFVV